MNLPLPEGERERERGGRRKTALALLIALFAVLAAVWEAAHVVRTERDAHLASVCASIAGGPETDAAARFAAEGLGRETSGGNTVGAWTFTNNRLMITVNGRAITCAK